MMRAAPRLAWLLLIAGGVCRADDAGLVDPTRPSTLHEIPARADLPRGPRIDGIFARADGNVAIVDGRLLHVGDGLAGGHVLQITADTVSYSRNGQRLALHLRKPTSMGINRPTAKDHP